MAYNDKSAEATPAKAQSYLLAQGECAELLFWARSQKGTREAALREAPPLSRFRYLCPGTGHPAQVCTPGHGLARERRACHLRGQRRAFCRRVVCRLWLYVPCKSIPARDAPSEPGRRDCAEPCKARRQGAWRPDRTARAEDGSLCLWHCGRVGRHEDASCRASALEGVWPQSLGRCGHRGAARGRCPLRAATQRQVSRKPSRFPGLP